MQLTDVDIVAKVRKAIDEIGTNDAEFLADSDTDNLNQIIISKVMDAIRHIYNIASVKNIRGKAINAYIERDAYGGATVQLPDDCLRLLTVKLSCWSSPINRFVVEGSVEHSKQSDPCAQGTHERPVVVECSGSRGLWIELHSPKDDRSTVARADYLPMPDWQCRDMERWVEIEDKLVTSVIYQTAGLTMMTYKDELGGVLIGLAQQYAE